VAAFLTCAASVSLAQAGTPGATGEGKADSKKPPKPADNYDELYARYLQQARVLPQTTTAPDSQWMTGLFGDLRARRVNDLVTVRVLESVAATGAADSNLDKDSSASAGVAQLFGIEGKLPSMIDPANLVGATANTSFKGSGATSRSGDLTAVITARVAEVLPNGDLALEGVREIDINGDRQIIVLTGVVRTADVGPGNVVPSTAIGQMRIRYFGRGLIKDNLQPGWLVRVLNKIF
jgi:flagellar L-ring protein precursor FlgH